MPTPVEAPKLGNTVEEVLVSKWRKHKGDAVSAGEVIAEIETDKTTFEISAPMSGTLLETFFDEGAIVPVFTTLCVIGEPGETVAFPSPQSLPEVEGFALERGRLFISGALGAARAPRERPPREPSHTYSPRALRFADQHGFHPTSITGSGPGGRVLEGDVRRAYEVSAGAAPLSGIREKIARRMRESLQSTAQYTLHASADACSLLSVRTKTININHLVTFCVIKALLDMPELNAEFLDGKIRRHSAANLGFACDTPCGLMAPVIRNAQRLTIGELAQKMQHLTEQAVQGTISADDLSGATFTISNLGALGIESFTPLLNPPQVAILGVGGIQVKPIRRNGKVEFIDAIGLSLTCDHQVIDGAPGARFLQVLKEKIENVAAFIPNA